MKRSLPRKASFLEVKMVFSGIPFLYFFMPIFFLLYYLCPKSGKNSLIVLFSFLFYGWQEGRFLLLMMGIIVIGYSFGIFLEKSQNIFLRKVLITAAVTLYLFILGYFKYSNFFWENLKNIFSLEGKIAAVVLPVGISFYIFQMMSYNIDVYRKNCRAQKNIITVAAYISMFPQLIAGPIVRYKDIEQQLISRKHSINQTYVGMRRFIMGISKKILLANQLGECCSMFSQRGENSVLFYWIYAVAFMLQIYYDFSAYSDMAIGLAKMMGFELMENFNYPYTSKSITEFWRRWHISLGTWFRDYLYIPLGGNRVSFIKWIRNIFVVWFCTGFWHGASWNFIFWGLYFALFLIMEKVLFSKNGKKERKKDMLSHVYVLFFVMISFILFDAQNLKAAADNIVGLVGIGCDLIVGKESLFYLRQYGMVFIFSLLGISSFGKNIVKKGIFLLTGKKQAIELEMAGMIGLLLISSAYLVDGSFNPFLYFRF